jgi:hypothetical protein
MDNVFISTEEQFFAALIANGGAVALFIVSGIKLSAQQNFAYFSESTTPHRHWRTRR